MKTFFFTLLMFASLPLVLGQDGSDYNQRLYQAYVKNEFPLWKDIIEEMDQEYEMSKDKDLLYDLCFAWYGYIGYLLNEEENKKAKKELKKAEDRAEELEALFSGRHDVLALRGALLGYRIVISKFSALYLSRRALKYIHTAYDSADTCFNCNTEMGSRYYYVPRFLGGSKQKAIPYYEKAVELLESSSLKADRSWLYINGVLMLANAYKETDRLDLACPLWKELLEYEPGAQWIRDKLYVKCK
jgi:tetratricopeptide (TPR) repeat protein